MCKHHTRIHTHTQTHHCLKQNPLWDIWCTGGGLSAASEQIHHSDTSVNSTVNRGETNSQTSCAAWLLTHRMVLIQLSPELQSAWQKAQETSRVSSSFLDYTHLPSPFPLWLVNAHARTSRLKPTWWLDWSVCGLPNPELRVCEYQCETEREIRAVKWGAVLLVSESKWATQGHLSLWFRLDDPGP